MAEDFYWNAAKTRSDQLEAELAAATADLQAYKRNGDYESAGSVVQQIADLQAQKSNLAQLWNQHVASQQSREPYASPEERHARPVERMDATDAATLMNESRYSKLGTGRGFTADDYNYLRRGLGWYKATRGTEQK